MCLHQVYKPGSGVVEKGYRGEKEVQLTMQLTSPVQIKPLSQIALYGLWHTHASGLDVSTLGGAVLNRCCDWCL